MSHRFHQSGFALKRQAAVSSRESARSSGWFGISDYALAGSFFALVIFGIIILASASSVEGFRRFDSAYHYVIHQALYGLVPGLVAFIFCLKFDYRKYQQYARWCLITSVVLLVAVLIPGIGVSYGGAQSWIQLGPISFQPTELVKILLLIFFAAWFSQRGQELTKDFWNGAVPFLGIICIIGLLIMAQPDLGTLSVIIAIAFSLYIIGGASWRHIIALGGAAVVAVALLIVNAPYRAARFMTFLHPESDPQGIGYHINQAFLAIGSGGIFGLGFGQSRQKFAYLPEVIGDSIFAIAAEELGFIIAALLVVLFLIIIIRGLRISRQAPDVFGQYVACGIVVWIAAQAFANIGAMVGLLPITGIPLPFISYGGTALMSTMAGVGILLNIGSTRHS
jgi:cell division protein FtsW